MSQQKVRKATLELHQNFYNLLQSLDKLSSIKNNFNTQEQERDFDIEFDKLLQSHIKLQKYVEECKKKI